MQTPDQAPLPRGNPKWRRGVSGNAAGSASLWARRRQMRDELLAELGKLNATDEQLLTRAIELLTTRPHRIDPVRRVNAAGRIIKMLRERHRNRRLGPTVAELMAGSHR